MCDYADVLATVSSVVISVAISVFFVFTLISFLLLCASFLEFRNIRFRLHAFLIYFAFLLQQLQK